MLCAEFGANPTLGAGKVQMLEDPSMKRASLACTASVVRLITNSPIRFVFERNYSLIKISRGPHLSAL
ncbi:unnamed protein product, partial [Iphiclides podalirius]